MNIAVLVSGSGSNLQALMDAVASDPSFGGEIVLVVADRDGTFGVTRAKAAGIPTQVINWWDAADREAFTSSIVEALRIVETDLVVLAGFMRILSKEVVEAFPDRIINVHPSLLPAFPGGRAVEDALDAGVKLAGLTVHFVDEMVDHGPIIAQRSVPVLASDTRADLHARIQKEEHALYPKVVRAFCRGEIRVQENVVATRELL
jgi:phosphoribosylglycinamide formyltransferase-1